MAKVALHHLDYIIFDFETTGLDPNQGDEIIEIGAIKLRGSEVTGEIYQTLVHIHKPIPRQASSIHGITDKELENQPPIEEVFPQFLKFIGKKTLIAHNAAFDLGFIKKNLERFPNLSFTNSCIDTLQISKHFFSYEKGHSLAAIAKRLSISSDEKSHRSLADCKLTSKIFAEFLKLLKRRNIATLHDIRNCILPPPKICRTRAQESLALL